ncbi:MULTISPECIES: PaaI family thioesterase [unclassified Mycobacterium]|uniref:PaaI family thioesterase n=1 Tax=unclassified Mycobacterium TaxID=2642494 RepID=UPI0029C895ED|nr:MULTISPECIES: PaaI family thioesterase [unclassified Mycobacterium]
MTDGVSQDDTEPRLLPGHTPNCFGCGGENASGLGLKVYRVWDEIFTDVEFDERYIGGPGLAHGGAIASACDELLGFSVWLIGAPAVTRALTIDYLAPVPLHETHRITGRVDGEKGRAILVSAQGTNSSGKVSFTASGVYVRVPLEHFDGFGALDTPASELHDKLAQESGRT